MPHSQGIRLFHWQQFFHAQVTSTLLVRCTMLNSQNSYTPSNFPSIIPICFGIAGQSQNVFQIPFQLYFPSSTPVWTHAHQFNKNPPHLSPEPAFNGRLFQPQSPPPVSFANFSSPQADCILHFSSGILEQLFTFHIFWVSFCFQQNLMFASIFHHLDSNCSLLSIQVKCMGQRSKIALAFQLKVFE